MRAKTLLLAVACALFAAAAFGATFQGRPMDGRWFEGRIVNDDFGAYDCQVRFSGDRAQVRLTSYSIQIEGFLEDEAISDPHRILLHDPKRGMYWTLDVFNLGK